MLAVKIVRGSVISSRFYGLSRGVWTINAVEFAYGLQAKSALYAGTKIQHAILKQIILYTNWNNNTYDAFIIEVSVHYKCFL